MERKEYKKIIGLDPYFQKYFVFDRNKNEIRLYNEARTTLIEIKMKSDCITKLEPLKQIFTPPIS